MRFRWYALVLFFFGLLCLYVAAEAKTPKPQPRVINVEEYTKLRAELSREVDALKERVRRLEERNPTGPVSVYYVDTFAGKIKCSSCQQVEEKK